jgi:hypothetical protein
LERFGKEVMLKRRVQVRRHKQKNNKIGWVSANDFLASDPTDETRQGIHHIFKQH